MSNTVLIKTNKGDITIELDLANAPITTDNFLKYVKDSFYDNTIFHRVIPDFMIQCGGFTADMEQKDTRDMIKNEADNGLKNLRGTLAMARTNAPDSATSQFFINLKDNSFLDYTSKANPGYAVFGKVTDGLDVMDEIATVKTGRNGYHDDVPLEAVIIESASII